MISKSGFNLLSPDAKETLIKELFPLATLITPNLPEAEEILGIEIKSLEQMKDAAKKLIELGPKAVLVKGGHLENDATDLLYDGNEFVLFPQERINTTHTHGTGCTLSSAIAVSYTHLEYQQKANECNVSRYILKPVSIETLKDILE